MDDDMDLSGLQQLTLVAGNVIHSHDNRGSMEDC
jgi:hypothetical protein